MRGCVCVWREGLHFKHFSIFCPEDNPFKTLFSIVVDEGSIARFGKCQICSFDM